MIPLRLLSHLDLSAASGLVQVDARGYVVADDERFLDAYALPSGERQARIPLGFQQELTQDPGERTGLVRIG